MVSALMMQGLDEMGARYTSYPAFAEVLRHRSADPAADMKELWSRKAARKTHPWQSPLHLVA